MNTHGVWAIYRFEMARSLRTIWQSVATPVITTSLYFVVFGGAIGSRISTVGGVGYGSFIVPGLIMLSLLTQSISNASIGIYFPKFTGTVFELLSAPVTAMEMVAGFVGAAATKSIVLGLLILATSALFVPLHVEHPLAMIAFLVLTSVTFSLFGFIIGIWANGFEQLSVVPALLVTPLTFLGGAFYSIDMLPQPWRTISLFNPVVYLISGFRWSFFDKGDVSIGLSLGVTAGFMVACLLAITAIFRSGWRLKN
ncbi:ABC transporter permease [Sphingomonas populi]|uniref:Transport permease protein n=1 Tax=Sphingomonas populi TaxID=2484750 RepID=A0A4Q6XW78_9SPHN|nr:ABC transporter permease [Sphingomonas populi]